VFLFGACFLFLESKTIIVQPVLNPHFIEHLFYVFSFPFMFSLLLFIIIIFYFSFGYLYLPQCNFLLFFSLKSLFHPDFPQIVKDDEGRGEAIMGYNDRGETTVITFRLWIDGNNGF
jgi:hypothetical protein